MMSQPEVEWLGTSCGKHGSYTFYKGFKLTANGQTKKYLLGEFYFVRNSKDRPICIAELQLVWHDANTGNQLASARLYFRPEATPGGRQNTHGKDELLYTDEKVVVKCRDMINLECDAPDWCYGMKAISELSLQEVKNPGNNAIGCAKKYRLCVDKTKLANAKNGAKKERTKIVILTFPAYCRYQSLMKKLANGLVLSKTAIIAFGGIIKDNNCTWVSFSRESFHHPELDKFDMFSDNKAPVLKGRPRKKKAGKGAGKGQGKGKNKVRKGENFAVAYVRPKTPESAESSDDNQTDTSEDSSSGVPELPCPPKLVSTIKEKPTVVSEVNQGVIRSVKLAGAVPPVPKLVKIEPQATSQPVSMTSFQHFHQPQVKVETMGHSNAVPICRMENTSATKMLASAKISTNSSVISSTYYNTNTKLSTSSYQAKNNASSLQSQRSTYEAHPRVSRALTVQTLPMVTSHASSRASSLPPTRLPLVAGTTTTNQTIRPRMSAIVSTAREQDRLLPAVTSDVRGVENNDVNSARHTECPNDIKPPLKRRRGRPPGKSTKYIKVQGVKNELQQVVPKPSPLRPVEMNRGSPLPLKPESIPTVFPVTSEPLVLKTEQPTSARLPLKLPVASPMKSEPQPVKFEPLPASPVECSLQFEDQDSPECEDANERAFMNTLKEFMKKRGTPIEKIPALGFRKIDLFKMFEVTRALGGYDVVTAKRLWRRVYNEVGGSPSITSAATNSRKHYERLLLPYERYLVGQDAVMVISDEPDSPSLSGKDNETILTNQRDQNENVIQTKEPAAPVLVPHSPAKKQAKPVVTVSDDVAQPSSVEFISSGSRGSPIVLYSSSVEHRQHRRPTDVHVSQPVSYDSRPRVITSEPVTYDSRPRVITSVGRDNVVRLEPNRSVSPEFIPVTDIRPTYITDADEDELHMYIPAKSRKTEARANAITEHERNKYEYAMRMTGGLDHVTELRTHARESRRTADECYHAQLRGGGTPEITSDSREAYTSKIPRGGDPGEGVLMMNVRTSDGKIRSTHSPRLSRDEQYISTFAVPVLPQTHFLHGVEPYDLPNGGFPLRTSSRIFMPTAPQLYPSSSHPSISPYPPPFITAIGPDTGTVYQLPIPGYFPQEIPYQLEGVPILRS